MGGGLMQIISYGTQDIILTANPEITFFNTVYRRYTNFGIKTISLSFDNSPEFNSTSYANIPKNNGDLISKIILKVKLPKIDFTTINNILFKNYNDSIEIEQNNIIYYSYFVKFFNKLKNIVDVFFIKYNTNTTSLTYITELKNTILKYFNINQYTQFFTSINYFFNNNIQTSFTIPYDIEYYTNASLFKIIDNNLIFIYEMLNYETTSYNEFKFVVNKNMEILCELNEIIYKKIIANTTPQVKFCWVNKIANWIFNSIDFYIGSNKIYSLSDTYINNYSELHYKNKKLYDLLVGNNISINTFEIQHDEIELFLPIPFWSFSNYGLSFPLIALQYNSLQIRINTKKLLDCIRINYPTSNTSNPNINNEIINLFVNNISSLITSKLEITMLVEYVYLDSIERKKFAQSAHEYLIEQVQEIEFDNISKSNNTIQLDIFHCCKDMFWFVQKKINQMDIFSNNPNVFNYTYLRNSTEKNKNKFEFALYLTMMLSPNILFNAEKFYNGNYIISNNSAYTNESKVINEFVLNNFAFPIANKNLNIIIAESYFNLNGVQLTGESSYFYNYLEPYNYYNATPQSGLNIYSFSLRPTEFQPSGACNMSRISYIGLKLKINDKTIDNYENLFSPTINSNSNTNSNVISNANANSNIGSGEISDYKFIFQTRNYNVLRIIGGIGATAYTY